MNAEERKQQLILIKAAISQHQENYAQSFVEIGRLLLEAKKHFGKHGEWLDWLKENVDMSVCKAQRLMRVAKRFPNEAPGIFLEYSKLYILTALPEGEIEAFMNHMHKVDGRLKYVQNMTKKELQNVVRNWLMSRKEKVTAAETAPPQNAGASAAPKDIFADRFENIKKDVSELADLINEQGEDTGNYDLLAAELCEVCSNIIQRLSVFDGEGM